MAELERRIKRSWAPPRVPLSKRVVAKFVISRAGALSGLAISSSSGSASVDQAALRAIENSAPFAPLPEGADENVDIQFTFDYNVFGGGGAEVMLPRSSSSLRISVMNHVTSMTEKVLLLFGIVRLVFWFAVVFLLWVDIFLAVIAQNSLGRAELDQCTSSAVHRSSYGADDHGKYLHLV